MTSYMSKDQGKFDFSLKSLSREGSGQDRTLLIMNTFEHKTNTLIHLYKKTYSYQSKQFQSGKQNFREINAFIS